MLDNAQLMRGEAVLPRHGAPPSWRLMASCRRSAGIQPGAGGLERVAARALELTDGAAVIGLGSGRAASAFIVALGAPVRAGRQVRGAPTSETTARLAREAGILLAGLEEVLPDVTVDGADEVDPRLDMIKGYGGALVRERIVAAASEQLRLQSLRRGLCDFILRDKDVIDLSIVCLRPQLKTIVSFDQFRGDTHVVALATHTSLEKIRHAKLSSHGT